MPSAAGSPADPVHVVRGLRFKSWIWGVLTGSVNQRYVVSADMRLDVGQSIDVLDVQCRHLPAGKRIVPNGDSRIIPLHECFCHSTILPRMSCHADCLLEHSIDQVGRDHVE